jgi:hypothetical protein
MSKARDLADLGSNDVLDTHTNGITVTGSAIPRVQLTSSSGPYGYIEANTVGSIGIGADGGATGASTNLAFSVDTTEVARLRQDAFIINEGGNDIDFRVESEDNTKILTVNAADNAVGINVDDVGINTPLTIMNGSHVTDFSNVALAIGGLVADDAVGTKSSIGFGYTSRARPIPAAIISYETKNTSGGTYGDLLFATRPDVGATQPTTRMRINSAGNVNINDDFNVTGTGEIFQEKETSGSVQDQITNVAFVHPDGNAASRGCKVNIAYSTTHLGSSPLWLSVLTPQAYSNWNAGGSATFKLSWTGYHASGTSMAKWDAVFGNNHGGHFRWKRSAITILEATDSYYGYTPNVEFYRQTADGNGFTGADQRMRVLWIKISGNAGSNVCPRRFLEIDGMVGHPDWAYEVNNFGYTAPVNISAIGASV